MKVSARRWISVAFTLSLAVLTWGAGIEPRLVDERRVTATVPNLPEPWSGATLALMADLQVGMWLDNTDTVRRVVRRLVEARPAGVLIAGDFVYEPTEEAGDPREAREEVEPEDLAEVRRQIREVTALLRPLTAARIPTYAVPGNHDYAMQRPHSLPLAWIADELSAAFDRIGVQMLRNQAATLPHPSDPGGDPLYIVGIDARYPQRAQPGKALAQVPEGAARVVFMHNPLTFTTLPPGSAPLALAAHTHGGQIRVPFLPHWSWISMIEKAPMPADGWAELSYGAPGNRLYVNRGIGFSLIPIRIGCPPELTLITLTARDDHLDRRRRSASKPSAPRVRSARSITRRRTNDNQPSTPST
jgi:predicted MPP superfamily phosphohydrolase